MMCSYEFDEALRAERRKKIEDVKYNFIIKGIEDFPEILDMRYNSEPRINKKEKSVIDEIVDNVYKSLQEINPYIIYGEVKKQVISYIDINKLITQS